MMVKERVLIFDDLSERTAILNNSLLSMGYEVLKFAYHSESDMQHKIHIYHPDYIVAGDDELVSLRRH